MTEQDQTIGTQMVSALAAGGCIPSPGVSQTEIQLGIQFAASHLNDYRFNVDEKMWHVWNGKCWEKDETGQTHRAVQNFLHNQLIALTQNTGLGKELVEATKMYIRENSARGVRSIMELAQARLSVKDDEFDSNPYLLNCQNGILDLTTVALGDDEKINFDAVGFYDHTSEEMHSRITGAGYNKEAVCPNWLKHLDTVFESNTDLIKNYQEFAGYMLFYVNPDAIMGILTGGGRNGKTACQNTLKITLGTYAAQLKTEALMVGGDYAGHGRIYMKGARLVNAAEPEDNEKGRPTLDTNFIKGATGQEEIFARHFNCMPVGFHFDGLICLLANRLPRITDQTVSIWDRLWVIPFNHYFKPEERDPAFVEALGDEVDGILIWMLEGYARYKKNGRMIQCQSVRDQTAEYRKEEDPYTDFIEYVTSGDNPLEINSDFEILSSSLYTRYTTFFNLRYGSIPDRKPHGIKKFGMDMKTKFGKRVSNSQTFYLGIGNPREYAEKNKNKQTSKPPDVKEPEKEDCWFKNFVPEPGMKSEHLDFARHLFCIGYCKEDAYRACSKENRNPDDCDGVPIP